MLLGCSSNAVDVAFHCFLRPAFFLKSTCALLITRHIQDRLRLCPGEIAGRPYCEHVDELTSQQTVLLQYCCNHYPGKKDLYPPIARIEGGPGGWVSSKLVRSPWT